MFQCVRVAVTGGAGQLGGVLLRRLIDDRKVKRVLCLDRRPPGQVSAKLQYVEADVRDPDFARHLAEVDVLVHLAFVVTQKVPRAEMEAINVQGSENVFRAALAQGCRRIVHCSSIAAYGVYSDHPRPITEDCPRRPQPEFPYAQDKFAVEALLDRLEAEHPDLSVLRFRPAILYGARMKNPLGQLLADLMSKGYFFDTGEAALPIVWDEDVADAFLLGIKRPEIKGAFNLSTPGAEPARVLAEAAGLKLLHLPRPLLQLAGALEPILTRATGRAAIDPTWRDIPPVQVEIDSGRAARELGWTPRYPTAVSVVRHFMEVAPGRPDRRLRWAFRLVNLAAKNRFASEQERDAEAAQLAGLDARVHLCLTGHGGGDWALFARAGKLQVAEGVPPAPTSVATLPAALFLDALAQRAELSTAQLTGKLRIEGEPTAGFLLSGMVARLRRLPETPGALAAPVRALGRWLARAPEGGTP